MNLTRLMLASGKAFIISFVLTPIVRDIFRAYNVVDRPGRRKVHAYPIPRVGGVPIALAYVLALISLRGADSVFPLHWVQTILSGTVIVFLVGLIDDFANLKPVVKLAGQIAAAVVAFGNGIQIDHLGGIELPVWIGLPVTVFWLLLTTNALNLIDGLDGLCAGVGFWGTMAFFVATLASGNATLANTVLPLAGALLGFLFFNFNPATVFLGDSGALVIGFLLGCFGIIWADHRLTPINLAVPLFALCVPMMDVGLSIVRRSLKNQPIFSADRGHIHHRLLDRGLTVRRAALALYGAEITGAIFGLVLTYLVFRNPNSSIFPALLIAAAIATAVAAVRQLRYPEFEVAGRLLFRGEFHRIFGEKLRLEELERSLARAGSREEWWRLLVAAGRNQNWICLRWTGSRGRSEEVFADRKPSWCFTIELDPDESIQVEGDDQTAHGSSDLVGFSSILSRSFQRRHHEWEALR